MSDQLKILKKYIDIQWHLLFCRPRDKAPFPSSGLNSATSDPKLIAARLRRWPDANPGVACAPSGLLVLDIDRRNDGMSTMQNLTAVLGGLPPTVAALTGGGGYHLYFHNPELQVRGHLGSGIDIKLNGYVLVWPSIHPNGNQYRWAKGRSPWEMKPAELPFSWLTALTRPTVPAAPRSTTRLAMPVSENTAYGKRALEEEYSNLRQAFQGSRNNALYRASFKIAQLAAGGEVDGQVARESLEQAALATGLPPREVERTLRSGWQAGLARPRSAPHHGLQELKQ